MLGKTHMAVGIAATMAITMPKTIAEAGMAVGIGSVGALISDIDVESSGSCRRADRIILLVSATAAILLAMDYFWGMDFLQRVAGNGEAARVLMGVLLFVGTCVFGKGQPHRSFMHSFLALALLDAALALAFPAFVPYFTVGFLSHLAIDILNQKKVRLLYPWKQGFCLGWCHARGLADRLLCAAGYAMSILLSIKALFGMAGR
ncbi:MAG: metal-dependent hydrolase [Lachnospiraceae bacterium]|nr:metal-dependent hydrolase [Lachnospiraceae bacterium]